MKKTIASSEYRALIKWLKECRTSKNINMRELGKKMKVAHTWVGKIEQAERRLDLCEYVRLCEALQIDPHTGVDMLMSGKKTRKS